MPRVHKKPRQQPHTFPEQQRPRKKRYLVTGPQRVGEVETGGIVELALTDDQEKCLLQAGCVEIAPAVEPETKPAPAPEKKSSHVKWADVKKNRPSKADTTEQE